MATITTDTQTLKKHLSRLQDQKKNKTLDLSGAEAFVEASFRIGIHSETPPQEAVNLLLQAHRLDGANPKYAYHLARLFFLCADFPRAAKWLKTAVQLCPTSHRLWAHVAVLQRELNTKYLGKSDIFEADDLKGYAQQISTSIQNGEDRFSASMLRFEPRPSTASLEAKARREGYSEAIAKESETGSSSEALKSTQRMVGRGQCRWSGVFDLAAEEILEAKPNKSNVDNLLPLLTYAARTVCSRKGGAAAFAILAIQMLLQDYPIEPILFLRQTLSPEMQLPSLRLLDDVCKIFQTPVEKIPQTLAALLAEKRLPVMLVALIHHHMLLAPRSLEIKVSSKYKHGRKLLKAQENPPKNEIKKISDSIRKASEIKATEANKKSNVNTTAYQIATISVENAVVTYQDIAAKAKKLFKLRKAFEQVVCSIQPDRDDAPLAAGQLDAVKKLLGQLKDKSKDPSLKGKTEKASQQLDALLAATFNFAQKDLPKKFRPAAERCRLLFNHILYDAKLDNLIKTKCEKLPENVIPAKNDLGKDLTLLKKALSSEAHGVLAKPKRDPKVAFENLESTIPSLLKAKKEAWNLIKEGLEKRLKTKSEADQAKQMLADCRALDEFVTALGEAYKRGTTQLEEIIAKVANDNSLIADFHQRQEVCKKQLQELTSLGKFSQKLDKINKKLSYAEADGEVSKPVSDLLELAQGAFQSPAAQAAVSGQAILPDATAAPVEDPKAKFEKLKSTIPSLLEAKKKAWNLIKEDLEKRLKTKPEADQAKQMLADCRALDEFVTALGEAYKRGTTQLEEIIAEVANDNSLIADFHQRQEGCKKQLQELTSLGKFSQKIDKINNKLSYAKAGGEASKPVSELLKLAQGAFQSPEAHAAVSGQAILSDAAPAPVEDPKAKFEKPESGLKHDLDRFKELIERHEAETLRTFDHYSDLRDQPPLHRLYINRLDNQAKIFASLGHLRQARRLWNDILRHDRLNTNALKNIAVCDTLQEDIGRTLASWRTYAEAMYFLAVARGNPTRESEKRAEFHHQFAGAYAPTGLGQPLNQKGEVNVDPNALKAFLDSPTRTRLFIDHKLFAFLNAKLQFTSPPLILGTGRTDSERSRKQALDGLLLFVDQTRELLPERIRKAFAATVCRHLNQAFETCKSAKRLTLKNDTRYPDELALHEQWVKDICQLKYSLFQVVMQNLDMVLEMSSLSFLNQMARLDDIPIDQQPAFLQAVGARMGGLPHEVLQNLMHFLKVKVVENLFSKTKKIGEIVKIFNLLVEFIAEDGRESQLPQMLMKIAVTMAEEKKNAAENQKLAEAVNSWIAKAQANCESKSKPDQASIDQVSENLDNSLLQIFFAPDGGLGENPDWAEKEKKLEEFLTQFPQSAIGNFLLMMAKHKIASQKSRSNDFKDAINIYKLAAESAEKVLSYSKNQGHKEQAQELLDHAEKFYQNMELNEAQKNGDFTKMLERYLTLLKEEGATDEMVRNVMNIFVKEAQTKRNGSRHREMVQVVNEWLEKSRRTKTENDTRDISAVEIMLDDCLALIFSAPQGELNENTNWEEVDRAMREAQKIYPENVATHFYRMMAQYQLAGQYIQAQNRDSARQCLTTSLVEAEEVLKQSKNESHRKQAQTKKDEIEKIFGGRV